MYRLYKFVVL